MFDYWSTLWIILIIITSIILIFLIKNYADTNNNKYLMYYLLVLPIYLFVYVKSLQKNNLSKIYPIIKIVTIILVVLISIILYEEKVNLQLMIGILFSIIAMYYLLSKNH